MSEREKISPKDDPAQEDLRHRLRHSASHVMAEVVLDLFPDAKLAIGPATDDGFYYDFQVEETFSPEDLERIEAKMRESIAADYPFAQRELDRDEARQLFADEPFKLELVDDIPEGVKTHRGTRYQDIADFPADRVIPDDYPLYVYYKWFWKEGDGWNAMHSALHEGLKSGGNDDLWTFHDPAVRVASVFGNGGNVDYLSHWTYSYPDPIRIGLCADELFCMARGAARRDQQVMKMR